MESEELRAFTQECEAVDATLADVPAEAWTRTALGSWTLAELVAHLARQASRLTQYVDRGVQDAPVLDRVSYFRYDVATVSPQVAARAVEDASKVDAETLPALFTESWRGDAELMAALPADRLVQSAFGPMPVVELTARSLLEVTVHHLDVRAALDLPPAPTPAAGRLVMELLEGLLGGPRPRNLGRVRFIQTATGRIPSDDPRFPVLA